MYLVNPRPGQDPSDYWLSTNLLLKGISSLSVLFLSWKELGPALCWVNITDLSEGFDITTSAVLTPPLHGPIELRLGRKKGLQDLDGMRKISKKIVLFSSNSVPSTPSIKTLSRDLSRLIDCQFINVRIILKYNMLRPLRYNLDTTVFLSQWSKNGRRYEIIPNSAVSSDGSPPGTHAASLCSRTPIARSGAPMQYSGENFSLNFAN